MGQAVEAIITDSKLQDIDPAYKANAVYTFASGPDDKITFDATFDRQIRVLPVKGVTDIYLAKDKEKKNGVPTGNMIDAVYMFASVSNKKGNNNPDYETWYKQKEANYAVSYR